MRDPVGDWRPRRRQRAELNPWARRVRRQPENPAGLDHSRVFKPAAVRLTAAPVQVEDLQVAAAAAESPGCDQREGFSRAVPRARHDVVLDGVGRWSGLDAGPGTGGAGSGAWTSPENGEHRGKDERHPERRRDPRPRASLWLGDHLEPPAWVGITG